jgi:hypothetical protein
MEFRDKMRDFRFPSAALFCLRASLLAFFLAGAGVQCWAAAINTPGPPASCLPAASRSPALPGAAGYGLSGPIDTDPLNLVDNTDPTVDICVEFYFSIPATIPKSGGGLDGWGALVLTFSAPIDGASFIFDPACTTAVQGTLNTADVTSGVDGSTIPKKTMVQLVPKITVEGGSGYRFPQTGSKDGDDDEYQQLAVTIMYDKNSKNDGTGTALPTPTIILGQSFWQAKTSNQFSYVDPCCVDKNGDVLLPEPSLGPALLASFIVLIYTGRRRYRNA